MTEPQVALSILEYEPELAMQLSAIEEILSNTIIPIRQLHTDVMREPFIPGKNRFSEEAIALLCNKFLYNHHLCGGFADRLVLDFHLMTPSPDLEVDAINTIIKDHVLRKNTIITIHREAYRTHLAKYNSKEHDLSHIRTGNQSLDKFLREENKILGKKVYETLSFIKESGYRAGIALEPGTSLDNITKEMADTTDVILLMSVISGKGGQKYMHKITAKIKEARQRYAHKIIQVDGGINSETVPLAINAGANSIVIGSYITLAEERGSRLSSVLEGIRKYFQIKCVGMR